jgi:hypothetical protein
MPNSGAKRLRKLLKQVDASMPLLFNFALQFSIRRVQINQEGLKLNGTHQLLVYVADVNILGRSIHTIKKNTIALLVATKEMKLKVNANKTWYTALSRYHNTGRSHRIQTDNSSFQRMEEFKYL